MSSWLRRLIGTAPPSRIDDIAWQRLLRRVRWAATLPVESQARLRHFAERFLAEKAISPAADLKLTDDRRLLLAVLCCQPVLSLGFDWLRGWHELIVYPGQFGVRRHDYDETTGVVAEWDDELAGEAWDRGPLVLSWADVRADLDRPEPGYQVVAHEIAHKLDALDGIMDGTPPLPDGPRRQRWIACMQSAFDRLRADLDAGREPPIDAYAAESPEEFFAVVSEYHFSAPEVLQSAMADVAGEVRAFYSGARPGSD